MIGIVVMSFSCNNTIYLKDGQYLYKESVAEFNDPENLDPPLTTLSSDLENLSKLKPNKKTLGMYSSKLWFYNIGTAGFDSVLSYVDDRKFLFFHLDEIVADIGIFSDSSQLRKTLTTKLGEPPNLIDSTLIEETVLRFENYLFNRGYFDSEITYTIEYKTKNRRGVVNYFVTLNTLNRMRKITYVIPESELNRIVSSIPVESQLATGNRFDVDFLKFERTRISDYVTSNGYYQFIPDYVTFQVDTSSGVDSFDIYINIANPPGETRHWRYKIRDVFIYPNAQNDFNTDVAVDTILYEDRSRKKEVRTEYSIIGSKKYYTNKSIVNNIFIYETDYYSVTAVRQTIGSFANLGVFKFATITPLEVGQDSNFRYLDMILKLDPLKRREVFVELNTSTTSDYLLGTYLGLTLTQKNTFKRIDLLRFNIYSGIETEFTNGIISLNTTEFNADISLVLPRFFWPFNIYTPKAYYPKTITSLKFGYLDRRDLYTGLNTSFRYGSERFEGTKEKQLLIFPVDINFVRVPYRTPEFDSILDANFLLKQSYEEQLIMAPNITYIYNEFQIGNQKLTEYFRGTFELAGTLFFLGNAMFDQETTFFGPNSTPIPPYKIAGLPFSNYVKLALDYRPLYRINENNKLAARADFGIAVPYWNSVVNPYVKQFYVGGPYDIRAFPIRKMGPGAYFPYDIVDNVATPKLEDQTADIKIVMSLEYRFKIIAVLQGALFCDVGNIWTINEDEFRPGSKFNFSTFLNQMAVGPGAGLRVDLNYFIFRFDWAYPLYDPGIDGPQGQAFAKEGVILPEKKPVFNFAIGYPF
ncbi:MAG: BamA/TamA family outer membrane protein [Chitinophagales bacterium]|nr:BamA/TamA family outer membrane protein [Chitinophagales bacterium]